MKHPPQRIEDYLKINGRKFRSMVFSGWPEAVIRNHISEDLGVPLHGEELEYFDQLIDQTHREGEPVAKKCHCGNCVEPDGRENLEAIRQGSKKSSQLRVGIERGMEVQFDGKNYTVINFDPVEGYAYVGPVENSSYGPEYVSVKPARLCELYYLAG